MKRLTLITMVSATAIGLAACDSEDVENTPIDDIDEIVDADSDDEGWPVAGELDETSQANAEAADVAAVSDEYERNRNAILVEAEERASSQGAGSMDDEMTGEGNTDDRASNDASPGSDAGMASGEGGMVALPPRSQMTYSWLDRNNDGRLSVAEYAIWALPTDPTDFAANDEKRPYLTPAQINEAGQTFFYFDADGDTYLSQSEFQAARDSSKTRS